METLTLESLTSWFSAKPGPNDTAETKRLEVDLKLRNSVADILASDKHYDECLKLVSMAIEAASKDICSKNTPTLLLSDICDASTTDVCEKIFDFVEDRISTWKSAQFTDSCRVNLLRMCNDLLRRLSRAVDVGFCGRILVFLAKCLPLTEKSGLNLISQFNSDNVTRFEEKFDLSQSSSAVKPDMEEGETDTEHSVPIDLSLYKNFWNLQSFFAAPLTCYNKLLWNQFRKNTTEVLSALLSYKLPEENEKKRKLDETMEEEMEESTGSQTDDQRQVYFAKYLTSPKLLQLQLNDSNFRRYVLVQFLILFQYLTTEIKFREAAKTLNEEQLTWVSETVQTVYRLLEETHPGGVEFSKSVKRILKREEYWNHWKNNGCEELTKRADKDKMPFFKRKMRQKYVDNEVDLANPELTRLWNICPDNFEACKMKEREFEPSLESFFDEAIEQSIPENQVDEQYRVMNDQNFQWRAFRLLARTKEGFFDTTPPQNTGQINIRKILDANVEKLKAQMPRFAKTKLPSKSEPETNGTGDSVQNDEESSNLKSAVITQQQIQSLANLVGAEWMSIATQMKLSEEIIKRIGTDNQTAELACVRVLEMWKEREIALATGLELQKILQDAGQFNEDVAALLKSTATSQTPESPLKKRKISDN